MIRLRRCIALTIVVLLISQVRVVAKPYVWKFDARKWRFSSVYTIGGDTNLRVQRRTKSSFVTNLAYYNVGGNQPMQAIDLYYKNGVWHKRRRWDWGRPVLVITDKGMRIDRPGRKKWKPRKGDREAIGIDYAEQRKRRMWRQLVGLKNNGRTVYLVKIPNATFAEASRFMRWKLKIRDFASFDGGHSCEKGARVATHLCAHKISV